MRRLEVFFLVLTALFYAALLLAFTQKRGELAVSPRPETATEESAGAVCVTTVVDLNTAGAEELATLPGIGPVLAERIVAWREENGPFTSLEDLLYVEGIGPSILEKIYDREVP